MEKVPNLKFRTGEGLGGAALLKVAIRGGEETGLFLLCMACCCRSRFCISRRSRTNPAVPNMMIAEEFLERVERAGVDSEKGKAKRSSLVLFLL